MKNLVYERKPVSIFRRSFIPASAAILGFAAIVLGGYIGHNLYSRQTYKAEEENVAVRDYLGTPVLQDFPQNSFGDTFSDILKGDN